MAKRRLWTKGKATRIERLLNKAIIALAEYNEEHDRMKIHETMQSCDQTPHKEAKDTERALRSAKFTFDKFILSATPIKRKIR